MALGTEDVGVWGECIGNWVRVFDWLRSAGDLRLLQACVGAGDWGARLVALGGPWGCQAPTRICRGVLAEQVEIVAGVVSFGGD